MIKLLKNELKKLFNKKIIYILLALTAIIIIINTIIGTSIYGGFIIDHTEEFLNEQQNELTQKLKELQDSENLDEYIEIKTELDFINLRKSYSLDSWQEQAIILKENDIRNLLSQINFYIKQGNKIELENCEYQYNKLLEPIRNNNWIEFTKNEIERYETKIDELTKQKELIQDENQLELLDNQINDSKFEIYFLKLRLNKNISFEKNDRNNLLEEYKRQVKILKEYPTNYGSNNYEEKFIYNKTLKEAKELEYKINNDIPCLKLDNARDMLANSLNYYEILIVLIIIVVSGTIMSEELNKGTIKLLLIKPYKRWQIVLTKFITCILMIFIVIAFIFIIQFLVGAIKYGLNDYSISIIEYDFNKKTVISLDIISYFTIRFVAKLPMYILISLATFMFSIISSSTAISLILGMLLYLSKYLININENLEFIKYFVGVNWDFSRYLFGNLPEISFFSEPLSIIICIITMIILFIITFTFFNNKDIKNI